MLGVHSEYGMTRIDQVRCVTITFFFFLLTLPHQFCLVKFLYVKKYTLFRHGCDLAGFAFTTNLTTKQLKVNNNSF